MTDAKDVDMDELERDARICATKTEGVSQRLGIAAQKLIGRLRKVEAERDEHRDGRESLRRQVDTMFAVSDEQEAELVRLRAVRDEYKRRALACPACEHRARLELENAKLRPVVKAAKALLQRPNLRDRREALGAALAAAEGET